MAADKRCLAPSASGSSDRTQARTEVRGTSAPGPHPPAPRAQGEVGGGVDGRFDADEGSFSRQEEQTPLEPEPFSVGKGWVACSGSTTEVLDEFFDQTGTLLKCREFLILERLLSAMRELASTLAGPRRGDNLPWRWYPGAAG